MHLPIHEKDWNIICERIIPYFVGKRLYVCHYINNYIEKLTKRHSLLRIIDVTIVLLYYGGKHVIAYLNFSSIREKAHGGA